MNTIKERLAEYLKYKRVNKSEFGRMVGVSNAYVSSIRKSIQPDKLERIGSAFPDLNVSWLLTGDGEMLKGAGSQAVAYGNAMATGDHSGASLTGDVTIGDAENDCARLRDRVEMLERLLEEKERTIQILMGGKGE